MDFNSIEAIKAAGFAGFKPMKELFLDSSSIPASKGVYLVLNVSSQPPEYLQQGTGGFFKGKNPNVDIELLKNQWVEKSLVVYIGKAGSDGSSATLRSRLKQYFGFGQGKNIGHGEVDVYGSLGTRQSWLFVGNLFQIKTREPMNKSLLKIS